MNEFKGTPGPWTGEKVVNICGAYEAGLSIGYLTTNNAERRAEGEANARLIVAAPDLLKALQDLLGAYEGVMHSEFDYPGDPWTAEGDDEATAGKSAIAKALGEQQ